jgi:hypothetical protein
VAVDFDFFVRNASSTSVIFFRHVSLTIVPYVVNVDDVLTSTISEVLKLMFLYFCFSNYADAEDVSMIGDRRWWSFPFVIYLSNFDDAKNVSAMLKYCLIDQNSSISDRLKKF